MFCTHVACLIVLYSINNIVIVVIVIVTGSRFLVVGAATKNADLPTLSLGLGTKRCLEIDDLRDVRMM